MCYETKLETTLKVARTEFQLTQNNIFLSCTRGDLSRHFPVCDSQKSEHALYFPVLVWREGLQFANTDVYHSNSFTLPIPEGKGHMTLTVSVCGDGLWTFYTFEQVVPEIQ